MEDPDVRERILDKAAEVGRLLSQTPEYAYLRTAEREIGDDRTATELLNRARTLQERLVAHLDRGEDPPDDLQQELAEVSRQMQESARYRYLATAQENFDQLMYRVHQAIGKGLKTGEQSRIILPS